MLAFVAAAVCGPQAQARPTFEQWAQSLKREAVHKKVSIDTVNRVLNNLHYLPKVIELDHKQPETTITFAKYRQNTVTQARINKGRTLMQQHAAELEKVSQRYGVAPQYIVALWGIETNYGSYTGGFDTIDSLATMAFNGRSERRGFFKDELIDALMILDQDHITRDKMKGSWAGAMGQNQFMPSTFRRLAVDGDGDKRKDIWTDLSDVFASTANKLKHDGWQEGELWGRQVRVTKKLPQHLEGLLNDRKTKKKTLEVRKTLAEWNALGIREMNGDPLPNEPGMEASLIAPDHMGGPFYLVYNNYRTIMKWNTSIYFATSVGLLANAIAQP